MIIVQTGICELPAGPFGCTADAATSGGRVATRQAEELQSRILPSRVWKAKMLKEYVSAWVPPMHSHFGTPPGLVNPLAKGPVSLYTTVVCKVSVIVSKTLGRASRPAEMLITGKLGGDSWRAFRPALKSAHADFLQHLLHELAVHVFREDVCRVL